MECHRRVMRLILLLKHVFSCMQIKEAAGKGYTEEELNEVVESVTVHGVSTGA